MGSGNRPTQELRIPCEGTYTHYTWRYSGDGPMHSFKHRKDLKVTIPCPALAEGQSVYFQGNSITPEVHFWCGHHLETIKLDEVMSGCWIATCLFEELE